MEASSEKELEIEEEVSKEMVEVFQAYQQYGTKLRMCVREKTAKNGKADFVVVEPSKPSKVDKDGVVLSADVKHKRVTVETHPVYAGEWINSLEELKTDFDLRRSVATSLNYTVARQTDEMIIDVIRKKIKVNKYQYNINETNTTEYIKNIIKSIIGNLTENQVPADGRTFALCGIQVWNDLMNAYGDKLKSLQLPFCKWGITFMPHYYMDRNELIVYHQSAIGLANERNSTVDITWDGEKQAHFICVSSEQGVDILQEKGVIYSTISPTIS